MAASRAIAHQRPDEIAQYVRLTRASPTPMSKEILSWPDALRTAPSLRCCTTAPPPAASRPEVIRKVVESASGNSECLPGRPGFLYRQLGVMMPVIFRTSRGIFMRKQSPLAVAIASLASCFPAKPQGNAQNLLDECDRWAASDLDRARPSSVSPVPFNAIDPKQAIPVCEVATKARPDNERIESQQGLSECSTLRRVKPNPVG